MHDESDDMEPQVPEFHREDLTWGDRMLVEGRELSPRHRKLAELAAQGLSNNEIAKRLEYTASRVSILLSNSKIRTEIDRIRERIYEETIGKRLRAMADPALNEIDRCLNDKTNRYKEALKVETAKWLIEKIDGKAVQKHDIGENLLSVVMDKLDALKSAGGRIDPVAEAREATETLQIEARSVDAEVETIKTEEDELQDWVRNFAGTTK